MIEMAQKNNSYSVRDSDTLQYFALEVFAYDIAVPSQGCPGLQSIAHATSSGPGAAAAATSQASASVSETSAAALKASSTATPSASKTLVVPPVSPREFYLQPMNFTDKDVGLSYSCRLRRASLRVISGAEVVGKFKSSMPRRLSGTSTGRCGTKRS